MTFSFLCVCLLQYVSELRFDGFCLRSPVHQILGSSLFQAPQTTTSQKLQSEVSSELFTTSHILMSFYVFLLNLTPRT